MDSVRKFQEATEPNNYDYFKPYIERMTSGEGNILIPGKPVYWGLTAGSTGTPKIIPITRKSLNNASLGTLRLYLAYIAEDPVNNSEILKGTMCFFAADPKLKTIDDIPVGFGTGVLSQSTSNQIWSPLIKNLFYSNIHLFYIKDPRKRLEQVARETTQRDVRGVGGVTSVVIMFLENILKIKSKKNPGITQVKDIFPHIQLATCGGESSVFYEPRFESVIGKKIDFREIYGSTEEIIAIQMQEALGYTPIYDANFLEFSPINSTERLLINEVEKNVDYKIIITNFNGFYAYTLGDVIKFTQVDPPLFVFSHREGSVNLASVNATVGQVNSAFMDTNEEQSTALKEYCLVGKHDPKPYYTIIVEFLPGKEPKNMKQYLQTYVKNLMIYNPTIKEAIEKVHNMKLPILWVVKEGVFQEYEESRVDDAASIGQRKVKHLSLDKEILKFFEGHVIEEVTMG